MMFGLDSSDVPSLLGVALGVFSFALLVAAATIYVWHRRRPKASLPDGWLTDDMVQQIIDLGVLSERQVPEEALDLKEVAQEEERFWSETWDEPERYWE
jgi:hypothetical protein